MTVAVLGGSFDPPHAGHLALARHFAARLRPASLLLVPAGQPWQKAGVLPAAHRLAMTELAAAELRVDFAAAGLPTAVTVDPIEIERAGPSYTADTLAALRARLGPTEPLLWLMGADQLARLHTWHRWPTLFDHAHLCVASRPGQPPLPLAPEVEAALRQRRADAGLIQSQPCGGLLYDDTLAVDLSSTAVRASLARGESTPPGSLPGTIATYIDTHHLYRNA